MWSLWIWVVHDCKCSFIDHSRHLIYAKRLDIIKSFEENLVFIAGGEGEKINCQLTTNKEEGGGGEGIFQTQVNFNVTQPKSPPPPTLPPSLLVNNDRCLYRNKLHITSISARFPTFAGSRFHLLFPSECTNNFASKWSVNVIFWCFVLSYFYFKRKIFL